MRSKGWAKAGLSGLGGALVVAGCGSVALLGQENGTSSTGSGGGGGACPKACVTDQDCAPGELCGQLEGDTYCAPECTGGQACGADAACTMLTTAQGQVVQLCVPSTDACGGVASTSSSSSSSASSSSGSEVCGTLVGPDVKAACTDCYEDHQHCQANGCYNGYWCNTDANPGQGCQPPPSPGSCGSSSTSSSTSSSSSGGAITPTTVSP